MCSLPDVQWTTIVIVAGSTVFLACMIYFVFDAVRKSTLKRLSNELLVLTHRSKELRKMRVRSKVRMDMALNMYKGFDVKIYDVEGDGLLREMTEEQLKYMSDEITRFQKLNREISQIDNRLRKIWWMYPQLFNFDHGDWDDEDTPISTTRTPPPALH